MHLHVKLSSLALNLISTFLLCAAGLSKVRFLKSNCFSQRSVRQVKSASLLCLLLLTVNSLSAHEIVPAVVDMTVNEDRTIDTKVRVNLEAMIAKIGPGHDDTDDSVNSQKYRELRSFSPDALSVEFEKFKPEFLESVYVQSGSNQPLELKTIMLDIPPVGDTATRRDTVIDMVFIANAQDENLVWQWAEEYGEVIVRAESFTGELDYAALLAAGQQSLPIPVAGVNAKQSLAQVVLRYIEVGFKHILPKGLDHVLFIIALFLISPFWKPLLIQATTFTVAHSITLFLGATNLLSVPASIVEPLIALSIVFLCIENLFYNKVGKARVGLVFFFGLLHGLGFAGVLGEVGLSTDNFLIALLSFNIGVEVGQLFVILICMLIVGIWFRNRPWYHARITIPASLGIGAIGAYWFVERVF